MPQLRHTRHAGTDGRELYGKPPPRMELPATFPRGRRCRRPGCITVLNMYNPGPLCLLDTQKEKREADAAQTTAQAVS